MTGLSVAFQIAVARARARKAQLLIASLAIAAAIAALVMMVSLPSVGEELVLRHTVERLRPQDRAVTVVVAPDHRLETAELRAIDTRLRDRFRNLPLAPMRALVEFRALAAPDGSVYRLGGLEDLPSAVRVIDGRLPSSCTPTRCEVLQVGPADEAAVVDPAPGIEVVGRAVQTDPVPFTGDLALSGGEHLLVADGTEDVNAFTSFLLIRRSLAWVAPITPTGITRGSIEPLLQSLADAGSDVDIPGYSVTAPDDALSEALSRAAISGRSLALPMSLGTLLLCGVVMIVALVLRGPQHVAADRLSRRGAGRATVAGFDLLSVGGIVGMALLGGLACGVVGVTVVARHFGLPAEAVLRSTGNATTVLSFAVAVLVVWITTTVVVRVRDTPASSRRRGPQASDIAAVVAAGMLGVLVKRGDTASDALATRSDPLLWAMPLLIVVLVAAVTARAVPLLMKAGARLVPAARILDRVALLDAVRRPVRSVATAVMVATAVAFATFTLGYRATLLQAAQEQAAFAVPFDLRLTVGAELVRPPSVRPTGGWEELVPGTVATDVLRRSATLRRAGTVVDTVDVVGLDPTTLTSIRSWRSDYGPAIPTVVRALTSVLPDPIGAAIPEDADALTLQVDGPAATTKLSVVVERSDGTWHETVASAGADGAPRIALEPGDAGGRFIGLRVAQLDETASRIEHHVQEGNTSVEAMDVGLTLRGVVASRGASTPTRLVYDSDTWNDGSGDIVGHPDGSVSIAASILGASVLVVPPFRTEPLPALVDPETASAATDGVVTVETQGREFRFRIVGTANRFPTMGDRFVLTGLASLSRGFDLAQPSYGSPIETWLAADTPAHERLLAGSFARSGLSVVDVDRRADRVNEQKGDPLSRLSLAVLMWSTALAGFMIAVSLMLNSIAERSDDEPFHRSLTLEGAGSATIRRLVTLRTVSLALASVPVGLAAGALMNTLVSSVVRVTADAVTPNPPLRRIVPLSQLTLALVLVVAVSYAAASLGSRLARRIPADTLLRDRS